MWIVINHFLKMLSGLIKLIGMLKKIISGLGINVTEILDNTITNKEELLEAQGKLKQIFVNAEVSAQEQVTKRWEADAKSDNSLSKVIRPLTLIFLTVIFVLITFFDGNVGDFKLNEAYIPVYQTLLMVVYGAYFAGRSIEKVKINA